MNSFNVSDLKENSFFTAEVVLDKTFLLLNNSIPVTKELLSALNDWNFKTVYSDGNISTGMAMDFSTVEEDLTTSTEEVKSAVSVSTTKFSENDSETSKLAVVQNIYNEYINYITNVYTHYATHKELNLEEISATVKNLCSFVKQNRRYVLRIQPKQDALNKNFLINHSMRSTVLAITIGLQLKLPEDKLVELGVACILHEIGQIRLPPQLYLTDRKLTQAEKNEIATHPLISYNILKEFNFPLSICLGVLEHHEKANGKGYPRHIAGKEISPYARIIAVACSFEAITSPRHYKAATSSYEAMVEMLKNEGGQYDNVVIKALLLSLSVFPIGAYVCLENGKIAQVVDVNPENPKNPIVQILNEKDSHGNPLTVNTNDTDKRIVRVLTRQQAADELKKTN